MCARETQGRAFVPVLIDQSNSNVKRVLYSYPRSDPPAVIGPVQERLSLLAAAIQPSGRAVLFELGNMPGKGLPSFDLALIVRTSSAQGVSAVPLEPSPGVFMVDPALLHPIGQRFGRIHPEAIQFRVMELMAKSRLLEPRFWKFLATVRHVFPSENAQRQHFLRC